jgi:uncharacterized OB-fold protein
MSTASTYLPEGLPIPTADPAGLDEPYWSGLNRGELLVQRCKSCQGWQWGPEWICHKCRSFDVGWERVEPKGRIYSWERVWHPVHPALKDRGPYLVGLVELTHAGNIRLIGNLLGDPHQAVRIGASVQGVFEHHQAAEPPFTLLQWRIVT